MEDKRIIGGVILIVLSLMMLMSGWKASLLLVGIAVALTALLSSGSRLVFDIYAHRKTDRGGEND